MDERAHERVVVDRSVSCQGFSGNEEIMIYDLSTAGCMVSRERGNWAPGETLVISVIGGTEIAGEIVWDREAFAGVRFTSELSEHIVALLGFNTGFH